MTRNRFSKRLERIAHEVTAADEVVVPKEIQGGVLRISDVSARISARWQGVVEAARKMAEDIVSDDMVEFYSWLLSVGFNWGYAMELADDLYEKTEYLESIIYDNDLWDDGGERGLEGYFDELWNEITSVLAIVKKIITEQDKLWDMTCAKYDELVDDGMERIESDWKLRVKVEGEMARVDGLIRQLNNAVDAFAKKTDRYVR